MSDPRPPLVSAATLFYSRGWMYGTAGNLSARADAHSFWITASGLHKGALDRDDFVRVALGGEVMERRRPGHEASAETSIHDVLYRHTEAQAVLHVHTVASTVASQLADTNGLLLPPLEMLKGFGISEEDPEIWLPVFENRASVPQIARELKDALPLALPVLLIRNHGVTTWGPDVQTALLRLELIEFVFQHLIAARTAGLR